MINITVENVKNHVIMHIEGDLFIQCIQVVENTWKTVIAENPRIIALDCKKLRRIDSTAIAMLVQFFNTAMNNNIRLVFCDVNDSIQMLFERAYLKKHFVMTTSEKFSSKFLQSKTA